MSRAPSIVFVGLRPVPILEAYCAALVQDLSAAFPGLATCSIAIEGSDETRKRFVRLALMCGDGSLLLLGTSGFVGADWSSDLAGLISSAFDEAHARLRSKFGRRDGARVRLARVSAQEGPRTRESSVRTLAVAAPPRKPFAATG